MTTILLVEDKLDNQLVIEDIFEFDDLGAELVVVGDAEEALRRLPDLRPALILMDIGLPGMSGLEATRRIRTDPTFADIPVWALTAHAMMSVREEALDAGCTEYVTKPINAPDLSKRLRGFIRDAESRRAA